MKNILIVDQISREAMTIIYRLNNNNVICCSSGEVALCICRRWKPDLIVVGDMNDWEHPALAAGLSAARLRPFMVAIIRNPTDEKQLQLRMALALEWGFDIAVTAPVYYSTLMQWAKTACLRDARNLFPTVIK